MELRIDWQAKKIRIIGNISSSQYKALNEVLQKLFEEDSEFMIVNEVETPSSLKEALKEAKRTTINPLDLINNPQHWVNPYRYQKTDHLEKSSGLRRQDPVVPWKMTYDNNDSIDQSLFKVTCTACADTCTHQILNPNPNDKA
jgi:hypothetical protein